MLRATLGAALLALTAIGCNDVDNRRPTNPPPKEGIHVDVPGVNVDVNRKDNKVDVKVNPRD